MGAILFVTFVGVPILEIALFIEVSNHIGLGATVGIILLTAIIGTIVIRHQGLATLKKAQASIKENTLPVTEVFEGFCIIIAGALLLTPGFFTDVLGLSLCIPSLRLSLRQWMGKFLTNSVNFGQQTHSGDNNLKKMTGYIIDGEFEDITNSGKENAENNSHFAPKRSPKVD